MRKGSRQQERQHSVLRRKTLYCIAAVCIQLMLAVRGSLDLGTLHQHNPVHTQAKPMNCILLTTVHHGAVHLE